MIIDIREELSGKISFLFGAENAVEQYQERDLKKKVKEMGIKVREGTMTNGFLFEIDSAEIKGNHPRVCMICGTSGIIEGQPQEFCQCEHGAALKYKHYQNGKG